MCGQLVHHPTDEAFGDGGWPRARWVTSIPITSWAGGHGHEASLAPERPRRA